MYQLIFKTIVPSKNIITNALERSELFRAVNNMALLIVTSEWLHVNSIPILSPIDRMHPSIHRIITHHAFLSRISSLNETRSYHSIVGSNLTRSGFLNVDAARNHTTSHTIIRRMKIPMTICNHVVLGVEAFGKTVVEY